GGAGACAIRHPRHDDSARHFRHANAARLAAGGAGQPRPLGAVPEAARRAARVRRSGADDRPQQLSQRRGDPPRRRAAHGATLKAVGGASMLIYTRQVRIEWGWCDPMGIVFFPRYFELFDSCTTAMFAKALGMSKF